MTTLSNLDKMQQLYVGYFGRAGDPEGLNYWVSQVEHGMSVSAIAQSFSVQEEATATYGYLAAPNLGLGKEAFITSIYENLFGREPDSAGLAYWVAQLTSSSRVGRIILDIINGAHEADAAAIAHKVAVANYYTDAAISSGLIWSDDSNADSAAAIATADATAASVTAAEELVDDMIAADIAGPGETFTLTTDVDSGAAFTGSTGDDTFDAGLNSSGRQTLTSQDRLDGGDGADTLNVTLISDVTPVSLTNIETINVNNESTETVVLNLLNADGVTRIENDASVGDLEVRNIVDGSTVAVYDTTASSYFFIEGSDELLVASDEGSSLTVVLDNATGGYSDPGLAEANVVTQAATVANVAQVNVYSFLDTSTPTPAPTSAGSIDVSYAGTTLTVRQFDASITTAPTAPPLWPAAATTGAEANAINFANAVNALLGATVASPAAVVAALPSPATGFGVTVTAPVAGVALGISVTNPVADLAAPALPPDLPGVTVQTAFVDGNEGDVVTITYGDASGSYVIGAFDAATQASLINALNALIDGAAITPVSSTGVTIAAYAPGATLETLSFSGAAGNLPTVDIIQDAEDPIDGHGVVGVYGAETINIVSGDGTDAVNHIILESYSQATTLNITGTSNLEFGIPLENSVTRVDASEFEGELGVTLGDNDVYASGGFGDDYIAGSIGDDTIEGGAGNDTIYAGYGDDNLNGDDGDDFIGFYADGDLTVEDIISGGNGNDTLVATAVDIDTNAGLDDDKDLRALVSGLSTIENLTVTGNGVSWGGANDIDINVARIGENIDRVNINGVGGAPATFTFNAGDSSLHSGLTFNSTVTLIADGEEADDHLTIVNDSTDADMFYGQNLSVAGFETLTLDTGSSTSAQSIGGLTMSGDGTNPNLSIIITGDTSMSLGFVTPTGTGLVSIDASGLTAQASSTTTLFVGPIYSTGGTVSITGSAGDDTFYGDADNKNTIVGGAGADSITGGNTADSLSGGAGNDAIIGGGGNDTLAGGDGDDNISWVSGNAVVTGGNGVDVIGAGNGNDSIDAGAGNDFVNLSPYLTASDTLAGGDGVDSLIVTGVAAGYDATVGVQTSGFETLKFVTDTATAQDLFNFSSNNTLTKVSSGGATTQNVTLTNAGAALATLTLDTAGNTGTVSFDRLSDTSSNALTLELTTGGTFNAVTLDDEESLTVTVSGGTQTITTLNAADLTSLTVSGAQDFTVTNAIVGATKLATVNLSGVTEDVTLDASASTVDLTLTGGGSSTSDWLSFTSGSGNDILTAGTATVSIIGGGGNDSITGAGGRDDLVGGAGNDTISGGSGDDTITAGAGLDSLTGGAGNDSYSFAAGDSVLTALDVITDYRASGLGTDDINVVGLTVVNGTVGVVQDFTSALSLADALNAAALANTVTDGLSVFIYGGNTYAYVEAGAGSTTYLASDFVVQIVGTPFAVGDALPLGIG